MFRSLPAALSEKADWACSTKPLIYTLSACLLFDRLGAGESLQTLDRMEEVFIIHSREMKRSGQKMYEILEEISHMGIVPVIALDRTEDAPALAKALCDGGLPCAEVTFRTAAAEESIRIMTSAFPDMLVGAGTVLTTEQAERAVNAGARFIVSPGLNPKVVRYCVEREIPVIPGCANPSDIEQAIELGLEVVKFFPAEAAGGLAMIKAMAAPYVNMKFMPTGGINASNLNDYLAFDRVVACGGSWMVKKTDIQEGNFEQITALTKQAVATMLGFEVVSIGINAPNSEEASRIAGSFAGIFGFKQQEGENAYTAGAAIAVMKQPGRGTNGCLAVAANSVERAVYHLSAQGVAFDYSADSTSYDSNGKLKGIYLQDEVGGFAVHLIQR